MTGLWKRLREQLGLEPRDELGNLAELVTGSRAGGFGMPVIESPFLPPDTFIIGAHGLGSRSWDEPAEQLFRFHEPLWEPASVVTSNRRAFEGRPEVLRDVYLRERELALAHLERTLDNACHDLGLDPEAAWKTARRDQTREYHARRNRIAYELEARYAFSILRPETILKVTLP